MQMSMEGLNAYVQKQGLKSFKGANPLGKEQSTFRFVNYLTEKGFIKKDTMLRNTLFCHKPKTAPVFTEQHYNDMQRIREEMEKEFRKLRADIQQKATTGDR